jgi:hypothetical protein
MARHRLAAQLDQTSVHLIDLVKPLHDWRDLGYALPERLGHFSVGTLLEALGTVIYNPVSVSSPSYHLGRSALMEWLLAAKPASETSETPKVPVGHITAREGQTFSQPAYSSVLALHDKPGSPALRIGVVMSDRRQPVVNEDGIATYRMVDSAQINFGRLAADGGVKGIFVPFTGGNVNHGAEWEDVPLYKHPAGMVALLSEVDLILASAADKLTHPAMD